MDTVAASSRHLLAALESGDWEGLVTNRTLSVILGLTTHLFLSQGEPDNQIYLGIIFLVANFWVLVLLLASTGSAATTTIAILDVCAAYSTFLATLVASTIIYRAFFHRLRNVRSTISSGQ